MSLAIAKKQSSDNTRKRKHDAMHSALKKTHIIHGSPLKALIQHKSICPCDGGCPRCAGVIQPKLRIGQANDRYEQEADRVAEQVMRMPEPAIQPT
jgi:hypothetical protein